MAKTPSPRPNQADPGKGNRVALDDVKFSLICEEYAKTGAAYASCEALGFNYSTVRNAIIHMRERGDDSWQDLWDESYNKFRESLERAIIQRGRDGTPTKWRVDPESKERTAIEWTFSDKLLELAARGHMPERYRDNITVSGTLGLEPVDAFANLTPKAKRAIRAIIMTDLEEQRQLAAETSKSAVIEGEATMTALADLRAEDEAQ